MGYYINADSKGNPLPAKGKLFALLKDGAKSIPEPEEDWFEENLVCIADNGPFECAAYCFSKDEFIVFLRNDGRQKRWLIYEHAPSLSGYNN